MIQYLVPRPSDVPPIEPHEIHFQHSSHLTGTTVFMCGNVTEVSHDEVVVHKHSHHSRGKGKEDITKIRFDCLVICTGRKYPQCSFSVVKILLL